jgi:hypothetical protein
MHGRYGSSDRAMFEERIDDHPTGHQDSRRSCYDTLRVSNRCQDVPDQRISLVEPRYGSDSDGILLRARPRAGFEELEIPENDAS